MADHRSRRLGGAALALAVAATTAVGGLPHSVAPAAADPVCENADDPVHGYQFFANENPGNDLGASLALADQFDRIERAVFCLTNIERAKAGVPELRWSNDLRNSASDFAQHVADRRWWTDNADFHNDPDLPGVPAIVQIQRRVRSYHPCTFFLGDPRDVTRWSENAYAGWASDAFTTARAAVAWWVNSPGHQANILDNQVTTLGVGVRAGTARPGLDTDPAGIFIQQFISCG
ncbi:CAP domain-containing protein [Nocardia tengchongensis]|uniref:CAP domain-containing protein n=1 Tax=Nocardia tengchongensis TaxID=2055889 RepID=A0ABX8CL03_9NOCA|nr:CAP domain-containing protein [Nocardia tengchongensis]QVI20082.1 CAP domain-containing protein [Nocardia tengchongensis]